MPTINDTITEHAPVVFDHYVNLPDNCPDANNPIPSIKKYKLSPLVRVFSFPSLAPYSTMIPSVTALNPPSAKLALAINPIR